VKPKFDPIDVYVGERLKEIRENKLKMTQNQLARIMGCTLGAISHYEIGRRSLGVREFIKLRDLCNVDCNELLPPQGKFHL
jgi:transcriptional regulator with XRE-family HTH domain